MKIAKSLPTKVFIILRYSIYWHETTTSRYFEGVKIVFCNQYGVPRYHFNSLLLMVFSKETKSINFVVFGVLHCSMDGVLPPLYVSILSVYTFMVWPDKYIIVSSVLATSCSSIFIAATGFAVTKHLTGRVRYKNFGAPVLKKTTLKNVKLANCVLLLYSTS